MEGTRPAALVLAALALVGAACGGASPATTSASTEPLLTTTAPVAPTTTTSTPTASTATASTLGTSTFGSATTEPPPTPTRSTEPREPWIVRDRRYYFPVQPPGVAAYGAAHHDYPATDIFAPAGSTLVAVTGGTVDEVGRDDPWDPEVDDPATRGGRYVSIVGGDGVRYYYSHLATVAPGLEAGASIRAGQRIGTVGTSGNARSTSPHVHFGLSRPSFPGDWEVRRGQVAPFDYLNAWADGDEVTPEV